LKESLELTILLSATRGFGTDVFAARVIMTTDSHIRFGRRPNFSNLASDRFSPRYIHLPVLGNDRWVVASTSKTLDGKTYTYDNGTAELDTGVCHGVIKIYLPTKPSETGVAFCYLDDKFVKDFYVRITGRTTRISDI
jgi:hypothetical protein